MTEEEKRMVMQFMGQTYGEVKKQDSMLVNQSGNLSPKSEEMKEVFTQMARQPTQHAPPQQAPPQQPVPQVAPAPSQAPVDYEQAVKELAQVDQAVVPVVASDPVSEQVQDPDQLMFDLTEPSILDKLLEASKNTNLLLKDIKLLLEKENGKPAKKKVTSKKPG
tara:strand:+ start:329 stop:820 length:492 start_codon:yes stop_codon:yes gene_type:complete